MKKAEIGKEKELVLLGFLYSYSLSVIENNSDKELVSMAKIVSKYFKNRKNNKNINKLRQEQVHQNIEKFHNEFLKDKATAKEFIFLGVFDYLLNISKCTELRVKFGHLDFIKIFDKIERNPKYKEPMKVVFNWLIEVENRKV